MVWHWLRVADHLEQAARHGVPRLVVARTLAAAISWATRKASKFIVGQVGRSGGDVGEGDGESSQDVSKRRRVRVILRAEHEAGADGGRQE